MGFCHRFWAALSLRAQRPGHKWPNAQLWPMHNTCVLPPSGQTPYPHGLYALLSIFTFVNPINLRLIYYITPPLHYTTYALTKLYHMTDYSSSSPTHLPPTSTHTFNPLITALISSLISTTTACKYSFFLLLCLVPAICHLSFLLHLHLGPLLTITTPLL